MKRVLLVLATCAMPAAPAVADLSGTLTFDTLPAYRQVTLSDTRTGAKGIAWAGVARIHVTASGIDVFDGRALPAFCIDIVDDVNFNESYAVLIEPLDEAPDPLAGPMEATKASQVAWLLDHNSWSLTMGSLDAAALQLAIWEVVSEYGGSYGLASGNFQVTSATTDVKDAAETLLSGLVGGWSAGYGFDRYVGLSSATKQDFVALVPVPGAVLLGALGLVAAGVKLRRFA